MDAAGRRRGRGKGWEALMAVDVVDDIYEGSHRVGIYTCPRIIGGTVNAKRK